MSVPAYKTVVAEFDSEWEKQTRIYGIMLAPKTLKMVKHLARTMYVQGRIDAMCYLTDKRVEGK